ncbi:MAG: S8 family serine peptidase, partial [Chlorobi bacterium]|nr:S8 family serine peptidase [Chlorobiota bacterium]
MKLFLKLTFAIIFFSITAVTSLSAAAYDSYIIKFKDIPTSQTIQSLTADYQISVSYPIKNIVNYTDNKSNKTLSSAQINLLRSLSAYRVIKFNNKDKSEQFAAEMSSDQRIESIEPNYIFSINEGEETGPDPRQKDQWSLKAVNAERAWEKASGKGIVVGVIDTGIDSEHPDLVNSLWINTKEDINGNGVFDPLDINGIDDDGNGVIDDVRGYDFVDQSLVNIGDDDTRDPFPNDEHSHGTLVSGVIAAQADNAIGIKGLAYDSKIMPLRAFDATGNGESDDIAAAIIYAAMQGANVINMSFGEAHASSIVEDAVKFAYESGCVLVASSGNNGWFYPHFPSDYDEVISVGASNEINERFSRSNYGTNLDLIAPGVNILSTYLNNQYR